jgi:hypothetical protein
MPAMSASCAISISLNEWRAAGLAEHDAGRAKHFNYVRFRTNGYIFGI